MEKDRLTFAIGIGNTKVRKYMRNGLWVAAKAISFAVLCFVVVSLVFGGQFEEGGGVFYILGFFLVIGNIAYWASRIMDKMDVLYDLKNRGVKR